MRFCDGAKWSSQHLLGLSPLGRIPYWGDPVTPACQKVTESTAAPGERLSDAPVYYLAQMQWLVPQAMSIRLGDLARLLGLG
jgi:hypothetical protein